MPSINIDTDAILAQCDEKIATFQAKVADAIHDQQAATEKLNKWKTKRRIVTDLEKLYDEWTT